MFSKLTVVTAIVSTFYQYGAGYTTQSNPNSAFIQPMRRIIPDEYDSSKPNLTVPFLASITGFGLPLGDFCIASTQIAVNHVRSKNILKNYNLIVELFDGRCEPALGVKAAIQLMQWSNAYHTDMPPVFLGPGCIDALLVGKFIKHYHFMSIVNTVPNTVFYEARHVFSNSFVSLQSLTSLYGALPHFIKANG